MRHRRICPEKKEETLILTIDNMPIVMFVAIVESCLSALMLVPESLKIGWNASSDELVALQMTIVDYILLETRRVTFWMIDWKH